MARAPAPCFPYPGGPTFAQLSPDEQAWVAHVRGWYNAAATLVHPDRALGLPMVEEFAAAPVRHWPMIVQFFPTNVLVWGRLLEHLTGREARGRTAGEQQRAWGVIVAAHLASGRAAAE